MTSLIQKIKWLLLIPVVFMGIVWFSQQRSLQNVKLPVLSSLPELELKTQEDKKYFRKDFLGHVTLVNFIFTSCPTVCPVLTQKMKELVNEAQNPEFRFVSISVDPENDSPAVLKKYGEKFGANWSRWTFLTGPLTEISEVVIRGFKVGLVREKKKSALDETRDLFDITHGEHFVLVDKQGNIRAYRMISGEEGKKEILQLLEQLQSEN